MSQDEDLIHNLISQVSELEKQQSIFQKYLISAIKKIKQLEAKLQNETTREAKIDNLITSETGDRIIERLETKQDLALNAEELIKKIEAQENNFTGLNLAKIETTIKIRNCDFSRANFFQVNLIESCLNECNFTESNFGEANLCKVKLKEAKLEKANLNRANLSKAELEKTNFIQAKLNKTNLSQANLQNSNLKEAELQEADLFQAN